MDDIYLQRVLLFHSCGTVFKERKIPVDGRILSLNPYPVDYCFKCNVYKYNDIESIDSHVIGDYITGLQKKTNQLTNDSPFSMEFLLNQNKKP